MKKFVSIMLSLFIFLMCSTAAFSADLLTIYFDPYEKSTEEKAIITSSAATDELNLYVAAYKDDKMVSVKKSNLTLEQGINVIETGIDWSNIWKDKVKLFVWDKALCPYDSYEFEVSRPPVSELLTFIVTANTEIDYKGNTAYRLSGTLDGKESRIIIYNPNGYGDEKPENFSLDDVILISKPDGEGVVNYVEKLEVEKIEGIVTKTPVTYIADRGVYDFSEAPVVMIGERKFSVGNSFSVDSYLGKAVTAYIVDDELYSIGEKADNSSFIISASQLVDVGDRYFNEENAIGYMPSLSSSKAECIKLDENVITYLNYGKQTGINTTAELTALVVNGGTIEFISNDADSDVECMRVNSYEDEAVIKSIDQYGTSYKFDCYLGSISEIDTADTDRKVVIYKDGIISTVENLEAEDTISHVEVARDFDIYYASSENVLGLADGYNMEDYIITIEGKDYKVSPFYNIDITSLVGNRGIFYLNVVGEISYFVEDNTARNSYALVTATYKKEKNASLAYYIQAFFEDGEVAEYEIAKNADIKDENNESILTERTDLQVKSYFNKLLTEEGNTGLADATYKLKVSDLTASVPENLLVTVTVRNGKIRRIKLPHGTNFYCEANAQYDAEAVTIMNKQISKETVVFAVKTPDNINNFIDVDKIKTGTVLEYFTDGKTYGNISLYDKKSSNNFYGALVALDIKRPQIPSSSVFVVASKKMVAYNNDVAYQVTGLMNGNEYTFVLYNENGYGSQTPEQLKAGDILIMNEQPSEEGVISDFQQVFSLNKQAPDTSSVYITKDIVNESGKIYSSFALLNTSSQNDFSINADIKDDYDLSVKIQSGASIPYDSEADYTLVDFTENFRTPEITSVTPSQRIFSTDYNTYVYVRYVDGKQQDVVVFRFLK